MGDWARLAAVSSTAPYDNDFYRWAPPALWIWKNVVEPIGFWPWFALHFVAIALLRPRWLLLVVLLAWPFWSDAVNGSTLTFVAVSASLALAGSRPATVVYVIFFVLMPRPLMVPVLAWLMWRRRTDLVWLVALGAIVLASSVALGQLGPWFSRLLSTGGSEMAVCLQHRALSLDRRVVGANRPGAGGMAHRPRPARPGEPGHLSVLARVLPADADPGDLSRVSSARWSRPSDESGGINPEDRGSLLVVDDLEAGAVPETVAGGRAAVRR